MKKLPFLSILMCFFALFTQCMQNPIDPSAQKININKLLVGQKSLYVRFDIQRIYDADNTRFTQTKDTLSLTVVSKNDKGFKIAEEHLDKSAPPVFYYFNVKGDSLFVEKISDEVSLNSVLFNFEHTAFVLKDVRLRTWTLNKWAIPTNIDQTNTLEFGKARNFTIIGKTYNKAIGYYNGQDSVFDGFTRVVLYTAKNGFICFHLFGGRAGSGYSYQLSEK